MVTTVTEDGLLPLEILGYSILTLNDGPTYNFNANTKYPALVLPLHLMGS